MGNRIYFALSIVILILFLSLTGCSFLGDKGCCIFGGKGKKEQETVEKELEAEPSKPAVSQAKPDRPLEAALTSSDMDYETDELDYEVKTVNGSLNWSKGFVRAKGYGVPSETAVNPQHGKLTAFEAARRVAQANLLEIVEGVQVTSATTVKDFMLKDYTIETKVKGIIKGAVEISREFSDEDQTAVVELGVAMEDLAMSAPKETASFDTMSFEEAANVLYPWETREDATLRELAGDNRQLVNAVDTSENLDEIKQKLEELGTRNEVLLASIGLLNAEIDRLKRSGTLVAYTEEQPDYTGVVINAAGSGVKTCMAPDIYYRSGDSYELLYGMNDGRPRDDNLHALVVWERTLNGASDNSRVTQDPFVVNATHLAKQQSALAISADDAKKIMEINESGRFLERGKVVIVR